MDLIRRGDVGPDVADVQRRLGDLGYSCRPDEPGVFGDASHRAVRTFQQQRGLTADGLVGDDTWRALVESGYELGDRLLYLTRPMLRGDDVRDLQRRLNRLGFDTEYVDGVYGELTQGAVREFQLNAGLAPDGIAGRETFEALRRLHRQHQSAPAFAVREREAMRRSARPSIAGARIMVDAGHGPHDPGTVLPDGTAEHEVNWQVANRLAGRLAALSANVVHARGPGTTPSRSARAQLANLEDVDAILSVHCNATASASARGAAAYYFGHEGIVSERGQRLAELAVDAIVARTSTAHCRTHPSTSTLLRESRAPAVLVEVGFLTHPREGLLLRDPAYQDQLAAALTDSVVALLTGSSPLARSSAA